MTDLRIWLASLAAIAILPAIQEPILFLWYAAVGVVLFAGAALAFGYGEHVENKRLKAELEAAYESLNTTLDEHALCPVPARPNLRVVRSPIPMQRRGDEWDRIVQAIEGETS